MNKKIQIMRGLSIIAVIVIHTYNTRKICLCNRRIKGGKDGQENTCTI